MRLILVLFCAFISTVKCTSEAKKYYPNWESLDSRPNPEWFDDAKIGLLMHWGVYSVPAFGSEWTSYMTQYRSYGMNGLKEFLEKSFKVNVTYSELAPSFTAALFEPKSWAELFKKSGVKYVVLTGKHVDGYTLWPSKTSFNWNSKDVGPKRDLFGELGKAVRKVGLRYGVYYSLYEIFNPLLRLDYSNNLLTRYYVQAKIKTELNELINDYKPDIIWSMDAGQDEHYLKTKEFLAWLFNESPVRDEIVVNDRWGRGTLCRHGGFSMFHGCSNSKVPMKHEAAVNIDRTSWGYNRLAHSSDYLTIERILNILTHVVSDGGNMILNIGPTHDGRIPPIFEERLLQLGQWLEINGVAIYKTQPWKVRKDSKNSQVYYTKSKVENTVFAIIIKTPKDGILRLGSIKNMNQKSKVSLITKTGDVPLKWNQDSKELTVKLVSSNQIKWFPVIKFTGLNENTVTVTDTPSLTKKDSDAKQAPEARVDTNEVLV